MHEGRLTQDEIIKENLKKSKDGETPISNSLKRELKEIGFEKSNELLHWLWYSDFITVYDHIRIILEVFDKPPFDCTFKSAWIDDYYFFISDFLDL